MQIENINYWSSIRFEIWIRLFGFWNLFVEAPPRIKSQLLNVI